MKITTVLVLGGSGFVGEHVCAALAARGYRVRVPTRNRERANELTMLPTVDVVTADVHDPETLAELARGTEAVINLVGVLHDEAGNRGFSGAHVELARKAVAACRAAGVRRLVHMSALNAATDGPSAYLRSKGEAEGIVRGSGLDVTIFRPSVIFGPKDAFLNLFALLAQLMPVVFLASPNARFQPVYVEDVAQAFVTGLTTLASLGNSYDLCGPKIYTLRELVEYATRTAGHCRPVVGLNDSLSYLQALSMEFLPVKLMTRDNYYSMKVDSVCDCEFPFGIRPAALEAVAPAWLAGRTPRARYMRLRDRAGR